MSKKIITLVEDEQHLRDELKKSIEETLGGEVEVKPFATVDDFKAYRETPEFKHLVRASIFDLANNGMEAADPAKSFSIKEYIDENYNTVRVPIIIYSAYLDRLPGFKDFGTVFKIEKTSTGVDEICNLLELMQETGFLEVFSPNGILEQQHPADLHEVFTSQFRGNGKELREILDLLQTCHQDRDQCRARVNAVFQRMALRALVNKLNSRSLTDNGAASPKINILEHFYRRTNTQAVPVWTGDILENIADGSRVYVMKPKCDLERASLEENAQMNVLVGPIVPYKFPVGGNAKKVTEVDNAAKHNLKLGIKLRIIPPSIFYPNSGNFPEGSAVDLSDPMTIKYAALVTEFKYLVTLSDDFVNEIVTRFGSYLVRPGIVEIDLDELTTQVTP